MKAITELTIDRKQWMRGRGAGKLLNALDEKMCCLGFFAIACGASKDDIRDVRTPRSLMSYKSIFLDQLVAKLDAQGRILSMNNETADALMNTNDSRDLTEEDREKEIAELMLQLNPPVKVTFIN